MKCTEVKILEKENDDLKDLLSELHQILGQFQDEVPEVVLDKIIAYIDGDYKGRWADEYESLLPWYRDKINSPQSIFRISIMANYKEEFEYLQQAIYQRALAGFYDVEVQYKKDRSDMVKYFHSYFVSQGYVVQSGSIEGFPFISVHWG